MNWRALHELIELNRGDFIVERTSDRGPFPAGTTVTIEWETGQTWPATIDGDTARWRVESEAHAAIEHGTAYVAMVRYPNAVTGTTDDYEWLTGTARR